MDYSSLLSKQRAFFSSHVTKDIAFRKSALLKLKQALLAHEQEILKALHTDLHKGVYEAYTSEIGFTLHEVDYHLAHLSKWAAPEKVRTSFINQPGKSYIYKEPYGVVLIIAPWNYPLQLLLAPLIGAIAAGNCAIVKPSEMAPATSAVIKKMLESVFESSFIAAVNGDVPETTALLEQRFDYIFYTGSTHVGRIVMQAAAKHLTPVTLELGGKSPTIVDKSAALRVAARRIAWAKTMNAGQTCTAPDYVYVHEAKMEEFVDAFKSSVHEFYSAHVAQSSDYARIINTKHHNRLTGLLEGLEIIHGGAHDVRSLFIEPTLVRGDWNSAIMKEEIFGPILPVFTYSDLEEVITKINTQPKPLALYVYTEDKKVRAQIISQTSSGGVAVNDSIVQVVSDTLPFGGVGDSGMGAYHGRHSFETFSHAKSTLVRSTYFDPSIKYPPYMSNLKNIRRLMRFF